MGGNGFRMLFAILLSLLLVPKDGNAEPIIIKGEMVPEFLGMPINTLRLCTGAGEAVPFQIDEITESGEYVCAEGDAPNTDSGNGILDKQDEIVFLWEDCSSDTGFGSGIGVWRSIELVRKEKRRRIYITNDTTVPVSKRQYIHYNHSGQMIRTPYFYARFGKDRFHFTSAGVNDPVSGGYIDLTNELRIEILLRALWGLLPIRYSEENVVCLVKRYKSGPIRLIRRGDFHLNLGLGIKGSRAAVNQICYPQIVKVPVFVHVPVRFKSFFSEAYIEMTPVVRSGTQGFSFRVPQVSFSEMISGTVKKDTMIAVLPNNEFMSVSDGIRGFGWVLQASIPDTLLEGSAFLFRSPSQRSGEAECGFRLTLRDLPRGYYEITNWVLFSRRSYEQLRADFEAIKNPVFIHGTSGIFLNSLSVSAAQNTSGKKAPH